jgi:hypothetical protein
MSRRGPFPGGRVPYPAIPPGGRGNGAHGFRFLLFRFVKSAE